MKLEYSSFPSNSNVKQSLYRPLGIQEFEVPGISRQSTHEGGKIISPTHRLPLPPLTKYPWYLFLFSCSTCRTVQGSIPGGVTWDYFRGSFRQIHVPWGRLSLWKWVPGISPGVKATGTFGWRPTTLVVPKVEKIRVLTYTEPVGPPRPLAGYFSFTLLIPGKDWAIPRTIVWLEGLCHWKIPMTPSVVAPLRLVALFLNKLRNCAPCNSKVLDWHLWGGFIRSPPVLKDALSVVLCDFVPICPKIGSVTLKQIIAAFFQIVRCSLFISIFRFNSKLSNLRTNYMTVR
jgi:hypothetical protein